MFIESDLKINQQHLPPFSVRACQQQIITFNPAGIRRTINGDWIALNPTQPLKYKTIITGQGYLPPALHHLNVGEKITIHCVQPFTQILYQGSLQLLRPAVTGSVNVYSHTVQNIAFSQVESTVIASALANEPCFVTYRPLLTMTVTDIKMDFQEWGDQNQWTLSATE